MRVHDIVSRMFNPTFCRIHTAAKEIEEAGGQALPCLVDIRDDDKIQKALDKTVNAFGGIDILSIKPFTNHQKTIPIR